jgi:hypothetical protein
MRKPNFHDIPCQNVTLIGQNFESDNPLTPNPRDHAATDAYSPFATPTTAG